MQHRYLFYTGVFPVVSVESICLLCFCQVQISDLKQAMNPSSAQLQSMLLDPAVNLLYVQMKREMDNSRTQLEQSQKDLAAWKFTPDRQVAYFSSFHVCVTTVKYFKVLCYTIPVYLPISSSYG